MDPIEWNWLALNLIPNLGVQTLNKLLKCFGSVESILTVSAASLVKESGISEQLATRIAKAKEVSSYHIERRLIEDHQVNIVCLESSTYPSILKEISAPPPLIYWHGTLNKIDAPSIGIVGSRTCTAYGKRQTRRLILELAEMVPNIIIISGLARGIDTIAHQTALEAGLPTIAVLASGLKTIYPPENRSLAEKIKSQGAIISEFPMGIKPLARNFPIRNRIISGLSQGILIAEAGIKSGALITAAFGLRHNREVFALPGSVESSASYGTNRLISRHHAKLITCAKDIVEELQIVHSPSTQTEFSFNTTETPTNDIENLSESQIKILKTLSLESFQNIDSIFSQTKIEINELLGVLVELELMGYVNSLEGQRYQLNSSFKFE